jgi:hypothetical protein
MAVGTVCRYDRDYGYLGKAAGMAARSVNEKGARVLLGHASEVDHEFWLTPLAPDSTRDAHQEILVLKSGFYLDSATLAGNTGTNRRIVLAFGDCGKSRGVSFQLAEWAGREVLRIEDAESWQAGSLPHVDFGWLIGSFQGLRQRRRNNLPVATFARTWVSEHSPHVLANVATTRLACYFPAAA